MQESLYYNNEYHELSHPFPKTESLPDLSQYFPIIPEGREKEDRNFLTDKSLDGNLHSDSTFFSGSIYILLQIVAA